MRTLDRKAAKHSQSPFDFRITKTKYAKLQDELKKALKARPHYIAEMREFASDGDFSENAAYQVTKSRLRSLNRRITRIQDILKNAEIIPENKDISRVSLGHFVGLKINSVTKTYQILGSMETAPSKNIISHNSPIGSAIMGHAVDDVVEIKVDDKIVRCQIMSISAHNSTDAIST